VVIVAIEGASCTGKSTLAAGLAARLGWESIGCYYHVADDPSVLGEPLATCEAEQLAAFEAHLPIEQERHRRAQAALSRDGAVILDRSVDTLLAHLTAVGRIQGLDATGRARARAAERVRVGAVSVPDLTLLLTAGPAVLAARAETRSGLPSIYYDPVFTAHFNDHFADPVTPRCVRLDAGRPREQVLDCALAAIAWAAGHGRR
jgi:dTMP kinase